LRRSAGAASDPEPCRFTYEDGPQNCERSRIAGRPGLLSYLEGKRIQVGKLYELPFTGTWLGIVMRLNYPGNGMDISRDAANAVWFFSHRALKPGASPVKVGRWLAPPPTTHLPLPEAVQAEAICYKPGRRTHST